MITETQLRELRNQATEALAQPVIRFVDIDPRVLIELIDVAEKSLGQPEQQKRMAAEPVAR